MRKIWLVLLLLACGVAQAASFDCSKAKTPQEKAICASPQLSAADEQMAAAYKALLVSVPAELVAEVREGQRQWIHNVPITCAARDWATSGLMEGCLNEVYRERTNVLRNAIAHKGGVLFVWRSVTLTAPDDPEFAKDDRQRGVLNDHGTLNASWPQATRDTPEWQAWNKAMEAAAREMASQGNTQPDGKWQQEWAQGLDTDVTTTINLVTGELVTVTINNQWYGHGAAHPNLDFTQFNWLLKERRELRPEDVFLVDSDWKSRLYQRCMKALVRQFGDGYPKNQWAPGFLEKNLHEIVANPGNWTLDGAGLTIVFQIGSVSCRVCVAEPVRYPWAQLKPLLNPAFRIPK
jgi:uncharacterized protein YecT (DUF1311 family)